MENYQSTAEYFENLCTESAVIQHDPANNKKKFFRMDIEEFISGSKNKFPGKDGGPFMVFINFIKDFYFQAGEKDKTQLMLYFLAGYENGNYDNEMAARNATEVVVKQFLGRMKHDSQNNHPLFKRGFDKVDNVRVSPAEIRSTSNYVGWQCTITFHKPISICFNENDWNTP